MSVVPPSLPNFNSESISSNQEPPYKTGFLGSGQQIRVTVKKEGYEVELYAQRASDRVGESFKESISSNEQDPHVVVQKRSFNSFVDFDTFCDATISRQEKVNLYRELSNKVKSASIQAFPLKDV